MQKNLLGPKNSCAIKKFAVNMFNLLEISSGFSCVVKPLLFDDSTKITGEWKNARGRNKLKKISKTKLTFLCFTGSKDSLPVQHSYKKLIHFFKINGLKRNFLETAKRKFLYWLYRKTTCKVTWKGRLSCPMENISTFWQYLLLQRN